MAQTFGMVKVNEDDAIANYILQVAKLNQNTEIDTLRSHVFLALEIGNPNLAMKIIQKRPLNPNFKNKDKHGTTPLLEMVIVGDPKLIQDMLDMYADPNLVDNFGQSPLRRAAVGAVNVSNPESVRSSIAKMDLLIAKGANVNQKNKYGKTILTEAEEFRLEPIAHYLQSKGGVR